MEEIQKDYFLAYGKYGSPRLCVELTKKFKVTTDSNHKLNIAPNLVNRNFSSYSSSMIWVSNITSIYTSKGFIYLYDRQVIGWSISCDMAKDQTVIKAFNMAKKIR